MNKEDLERELSECRKANIALSVVLLIAVAALVELALRTA